MQEQILNLESCSKSKQKLRLGKKKTFIDHKVGEKLSSAKSVRLILIK